MIDRFPFVSVIMPVRNEEKFIEKSLGAILGQDYPHNRYEVLVVDGMSTDSTRDIVKRLAEKSDVPVRILDNPRRIVPSAMNIGIRAARGDVIVRMDGHAVAAEDYVRLCVQALRETGADNVGGQVEYSGGGVWARASRVVMKSFLGAGGAPARAGRSGAVDTVSFGCWPKESFQRFGLFDETFIRTQDSELNYRIRREGGTVWLDSRIRSVYFGRGSLSAIWRQYFQYGFWKTRLMYKHPGALRWRHFVPPLFMVGVIASLSMSLAAVMSSLPFLAISAGSLPALYAILVLGHALYWRQKGELSWRECRAVIVLIPVIHAAWGMGFLYGLMRPPSGDLPS